MPFRAIRNVPVVLLFCTTLTWATQSEPDLDAGGCRQVASQLPQAASTFGRGLAVAPRDAVRPSNLKWELPIAAATGLLIVSVDNHVNNHIRSASFAQDAARGSNVGLGIELGAAGLAYLVGCSEHRSPYMASSGFTALEAMGAASVVGLGIKTATNRQYAYAKNTHGEFWEGGGSFPSGHAAASFAFASVIAHRYPKNPWLKWGAYGLASSVSFARVAGKKHFVSDIVAGGVVGYVTGTYMSTR
jgi:membrane-associated phospholipid phosphatase